MTRRIVRSQYPLGAISWNEHRLIASALASRHAKGEGLFSRGDRLYIEDKEQISLADRRIAVTEQDAVGKLLFLKNEFSLHIASGFEILDHRAAFELTHVGHAIVKGIERNGLATGLLEHTAAAPSWREALIAELAVFFSKEPGKAKIPLNDFRWWLGIESQYPRLANIKDAIIEPLKRTTLNLKLIDEQETYGKVVGHVSFSFTPPQTEPLAHATSPFDKSALGLANKLKIPSIAAATILDDAKELRPGASQGEIVDLLTA